VAVCAYSNRSLTPAVALVEQSKIYPLNGNDAAKPMQFPDATVLLVGGAPDQMIDRVLIRRCRYAIMCAVGAGPSMQLVPNPRG
jgi:hypothetical protein